MDEILQALPWIDYSLLCYPMAGRSTIDFSGRIRRTAITPAAAASAAIKKEKFAGPIEFQNPPSQPAIALPVKFVASHNAIISETMRAGATYDTSDNPVGHT